MARCHVGGYTTMTNPQHEALVEAVARAIYEEDDPWHKAWPWPDLNPEAQGGLASVERYRAIAIAALSATAATPSDEVVRLRVALESAVYYITALENVRDGIRVTDLDEAEGMYARDLRAATEPQAKDV